MVFLSLDVFTVVQQIPFCCSAVLLAKLHLLLLSDKLFNPSKVYRLLGHLAAIYPLSCFPSSATHVILQNRQQKAIDVEDLQLDDLC